MTTWNDPQPLSHAERQLRWRRIRIAIVVIAVGVLLFLGLSYRYSPSRPVTHDAIEEHFKYGSIGSDVENGLPLAVMRVLPRMFARYLPPGGPTDYTAFGFIQEPGHDMPIGFSVRRRFIDLTGLNCAVCHTGSVREKEGAEPRIYLTMPANTVDLLSFFRFLFQCAADDEFNPDRVLAEIEKDGALFPPDRILFRFAIQQMKDGLLLRRDQLSIFTRPDYPPFGPGRVDTFTTYKTNQFAHAYPEGVPESEWYGTVDFPSIWLQGPREGMHLHWDGNNTKVRERNVSAAFGAGATRENVDLPKIERIKEWLDTLPPPAYPYVIDKTQLARGEEVYKEYCARCHAFDGKEVGKVVPLAQIKTDSRRFDSYTEKLQRLQVPYGDGYNWSFRHFQKTDGYANMPLDGLWARAPYLHNGSVPTMWDLLLPEDKRPPEFYRGGDVYNQKLLGFETKQGGRNSFLFNTRAPGNDNKGHSGRIYGTELSDADKWALLEYLKTL